MIAPKIGMLAALLVGAVGLASASEFDQSYGYSQTATVIRSEPVQATERRWIPPHYETRAEQVLIAPAHDERRYVEPVCVSRYDRRILTTGYWIDVCVPAQYETRMTQFLIPGYYRDVAVACNSGAPSCEYQQPAAVVSAPVASERRWIPEHYETRASRILVPGCYQDESCRDNAYTEEHNPERRR